MSGRTAIRSAGLLVALAWVAACSVPKLNELGPRRCDDQHACIAGYECVLGTCEPDPGSKVPGGDGGAGHDGGSGNDGGTGTSDGGQVGNDGGTDQGCSPGTFEPCDPGPGCGSGTRTCGPDRLFGPCVSEFAGATEVCNGKDDNCDGITDALPDGGALVEASCANTKGVCANAVRTCVGGAFGACDYGPQYESFERACDGLDNDCDGRVDVSRGIGPIASGVYQFDWALSDDGFRVLYLKGEISSGVMYQRYDRNWNPIGVTVNRANVPWGGHPRILSRGNESAVAFTGYDTSSGEHRILIARLDLAGNHLLTEGTGTGHAIFVNAGPHRTEALEIAYGTDGQSLVVFWLNQAGVFASSYDLDGVLISNRALLTSSAGVTISSMDVLPRSGGGFLVGLTVTDVNAGWSGGLALTVSGTLQTLATVRKDSVGAPHSVRLFPDPQSAAGLSMAWLSVEAPGQNLLLWSTRTPLTDPREQVWNVNFGSPEANLVGAAATATGSSYLMASPLATSLSYLYRYRTAAPSSFLQGRLDGFEADGFSVLWDPVETSWWIGYVAGGGIQLARVCGP